MKTSAEFGRLQGQNGDVPISGDSGPGVGWDGGFSVETGGDEGAAGKVAAAAGVAGMVGEGIRARGYHVMPVGEVAGLAGIGPVCGAEFLRQLHRFASENGWEAAVPRGLGRVLFQPIGDRRMVPAIWRLQRPD